MLQGPGDVRNTTVGTCYCSLTGKIKIAVVHLMKPALHKIRWKMCGCFLAARRKPGPDLQVSGLVGLLRSGTETGEAIPRAYLIQAKGRS